MSEHGARILVVLMLCRSCVGNHSYCEFVIAAVTPFQQQVSYQKFVCKCVECQQEKCLGETHPERAEWAESSDRSSKKFSEEVDRTLQAEGKHWKYKYVSVCQTTGFSVFDEH